MAYLLGSIRLQASIEAIDTAVLIELESEGWRVRKDGGLYLEDDAGSAMGGPLRLLSRHAGRLPGGLAR